MVMEYLQANFPHLLCILDFFGEIQQDLDIWIQQDMGIRNCLIRKTFTDETPDIHYVTPCCHPIHQIIDMPILDAVYTTPEGSAVRISLPASNNPAALINWRKHLMTFLPPTGTHLPICALVTATEGNRTNPSLLLEILESSQNSRQATPRKEKALETWPPPSRTSISQ